MHCPCLSHRTTKSDRFRMRPRITADVARYIGRSWGIQEFQDGVEERGIECLGSGNSDVPCVFTVSEGK